jgi:hypothetical protein
LRPLSISRSSEINSKYGAVEAATATTAATIASQRRRGRLCDTERCVFSLGFLHEDDVAVSTGKTVFVGSTIREGVTAECAAQYRRVLAADETDLRAAEAKREDIKGFTVTTRKREGSLRGVFVFAVSGFTWLDLVDERGLASHRLAVWRRDVVAEDRMTAVACSLSISSEDDDTVNRVAELSRRSGKIRGMLPQRRRKIG